ncbi:MAG: LysR family transcriptional regulator [Burkholderiales bacterium]|nr:LysR family transcriptional regulator [Burkholderiales bacterium]
MNLRQLQHLLALADEGRFVAAAERVHLSQAAFSRSIQALETDFGLRLFERGPLGATPTPAGRLLIERARRLVFDGRCLERDAELLKRGELGNLDFGAGPVPAAVLVPPLLAELRRQAPRVVARVRSGNVDSLLRLLDVEVIDFFVADPRLLPHTDRLELRPLAKVHGALYVRTGHPLLQAGAATPQDLATHGLGMVSMTPVLHAQVAQALGFDRVEDFPLAVECDDLHTLARLALEGDMLALLPHALVAASGLALQALPAPRLNAEGLFAHVHAVWLRGRTLAPAAELAMRAFQALAEQPT